MLQHIKHYICEVFLATDKDIFYKKGVNLNTNSPESRKDQ